MKKLLILIIITFFITTLGYCEKLKLAGIAFDSEDTEKSIIKKFRLTGLIKLHSYIGGKYFIESSSWPRKKFGSLLFENHKLKHMTAIWSENCTSTTDYMQTLFDIVEKYKTHKTLWAKLNVRNINSPNMRVQEIQIALGKNKKIKILIDTKKSKVEIIEELNF
ncbi:hypothetical protein KAJ27_00265 [bacterium]|nr:hypothetical protein [bacterium]